MFDMRKNGVLLCLVEAMNFVDKQNSALSGELPQSPGIFHHFSQVGYARRDSTEPDEVCMRLEGNYLSERGLAAARRPPEDHGRNGVCLNAAAQNSSWPQDVLLPDNLIESARSHSCGQRFP